MLKGPLAYKVPEEGWASRPEFSVLSLGLPADTRLLGKTAQTLRFFSRGVKAVLASSRLNKRGALISGTSDHYLPDDDSLGSSLWFFSEKLDSLLLPLVLLTSKLRRWEGNK